MSQVSRRQLLRGVAGASLALPFLPSLSREAHAGPPPKAQPRFVALSTGHGGVWTTSMFPQDALLTKTQSYRGHDIRQGALAADVQNGRASLSPTLSGDASKLTAKLIAKMNVIQGLDHPFYIGHHSGGHLGNYARNDGNGGDGIAMQAFPRPTIDQIMAWSPTFYSDIGAIKERSLVVGDRMSFNWADAAKRQGDIQQLTGSFDCQDLFNRIFVPPPVAGSQRKPLVDRVLDSYKRLRNGNRRLSAGDRQRLDEHLSRVDELQRKLSVKVTCDGVSAPKGDSAAIRLQQGYEYKADLHDQSWELLNDVIVAAFVCNTCRIATLSIPDTFSDYQGDWHQSIAHQANIIGGPAQPTLQQAHQRTFEKVFVDLIAKLDAVDDGNGGTLLDACLVQWTQESGNNTHDGNSIPLITAGRAAGALPTGQYLDFRNLGAFYGPYANKDAPPEIAQHSGLAYNQWLGNVLDLMGLPRAEWTDLADQGGYGKFLLGEGYVNSYDAKVFAGMDERLPWLG
jgi:hypothetical protein